MDAPQPSPRKGRARERYERRRARQEGAPYPAAGRSIPRQLKPAGGFELPKIPLPQSRMIFYGLGAIAFAAVLVFALGMLKPDVVVADPNAIWIGTEWTYDQPDDATLNNLVSRLRDHDVGTVYAWVSWLQEDGSWRGTANFEAVKTFVERFNEAYPEAELYGWVSFPVNVGDDDGYRMDDDDLQQKVADFSQRVIGEFGFDGVHLNVEPVWNDNSPDFLELLRKVRAAVGDDTPISVAVPPDWSPADAQIPVPPLITPGTFWEKQFKQRVALLADEMVIMAYNGGLSKPEDYSEWVAYQVRSYAEALSDPVTGTELVIGIPTYDKDATEPPAHDPLIENVESAVIGIREGLAQAGDAASVVEGIAIYAEWETDATEWLEFKTDWLGS
jgi:hypothetical protein